MKTAKVAITVDVQHCHVRRHEQANFEASTLHCRRVLFQRKLLHVLGGCQPRGARLQRVLVLALHFPARVTVALKNKITKLRFIQVL